MSNITVTVNGTAVSYTTYNPLTGLPPAINADFSWYYYLVNGNSSTQTITVQQDYNQLAAIYFCLIGPGGNGGALGTDDGAPGGGAGGGVVEPY
jgi:hypothetical protein